eukprot:9118312-Heterocapsa_arctica.AAC.1
MDLVYSTQRTSHAGAECVRMTNLTNNTLNGSSARFELAEHVPGTTHDIYGLGGTQANQMGSGVHTSTLDLGIHTTVEHLLGI